MISRGTDRYAGEELEWEFDEEEITWYLDRSRLDGGSLMVLPHSTARGFMVRCANLDELEVDAELGPFANEDRAIEVAEWVTEFFPEGWVVFDWERE